MFNSRTRSGEGVAGTSGRRFHGITRGLALFLGGFSLLNMIGESNITGFDANPAGGGQDLLDVIAYGFNATTFGTGVVITTGNFDAAAGIDTRVTIGADVILLSDDGANAANSITIADFLLS